MRPETSLKRILAPLGLRFDPGQLRWAEPVKHSFAEIMLGWIRKVSRSSMRDGSSVSLLFRSC